MSHRKEFLILRENTVISRLSLFIRRTDDCHAALVRFMTSMDSDPSAPGHHAALVSQVTLWRNDQSHRLWLWE